MSTILQQYQRNVLQFIIHLLFRRHVAKLAIKVVSHERIGKWVFSQSALPSMANGKELGIRILAGYGKLTGVCIT
jgi:hypothetical protein